MISTSALYSDYESRMKKIADIRFATAVLQWDQETYLPPESGHFRGQQISTLTELSHQIFTDDALGDLLKRLLEKSDLDEVQRRNIERSFYDYSRSKKYPAAFVRTLSDQINKCFHSWIEARKQNNFSIYRENLSQLIDLKRQETELLGYAAHPYDALLDEFERGATVSLLDHTFSNLLPQLSDLLRQVNSMEQVDDSFLKQHFPKDQQWQWSMFLLKKLGYDFNRGRQDISEHPFSISFNPHDVRITTRINENDFSSMTWSCIHELGHAHYEQGLPVAAYGLPLAEACSYSIHESQSRLWENCVGRSLELWQHYYPDLQRFFPEQFSKVPVEQFFKAINKVAPSLIRTEADEITYHFHVFIRYELEKKLIDGMLKTEDIPAFWNEAYQQYLGVSVPDDKRGVLQDVHWSHGSFGYFPTYSLGSFYAAQFFAEAVKQMPELMDQIGKGDTGNLLLWLRKNIHEKGRYHLSEALCEQVTGEKLNVVYFMNYLRTKYNQVYNQPI